MPNRFAKGRRDENERSIVEVIEQYHILYRYGREGDGYDLIVLTSPPMFWEVKNPAQPESKRTLTACEQMTKDYCKDNCISYFVVETADEAATILYNALIKRPVFNGCYAD